MMPDQTPLNPEALRDAGRALYEHVKSQQMDGHPWEEWEDLGEGQDIAIGEAEAAVSAYLSAATAIEYAGSHKHGGLETTDEDGCPFESAEHVRENYADYPNCTPMYRLVTEWQELNKDMQ